MENCGGFSQFSSFHISEKSHLFLTLKRPKNDRMDVVTVPLMGNAD